MAVPSEADARTQLLDDGRGDEGRLVDWLYKHAAPSQLHLYFSCCGVIACLGLYGVQQERIMAMPYGEEFFACTLFLVFLNRVGAVVLAFCCALYKGELITPAAP